MSSSTRQVFLDIESGGLRPSDRPWEIAAITREADGTEKLYVWHIIDFDPSQADPTALEIGKFYERHPRHFVLDPADPLRIAPDAEEQMLHPVFNLRGPDLDAHVRHMLCTETRAATELERLVRGAVVWACNPAYDVPRLEAMLSRNMRAWTAHYRPLCATTYAAGALAASGAPLPPLPWSNSALGELLGVKRDVGGTVHTGLADCYYVRGLVDAVNALAPQAAL